MIMVKKVVVVVMKATAVVAVATSWWRRRRWHDGDGSGGGGVVVSTPYTSSQVSISSFITLLYKSVREVSNVEGLLDWWRGFKWRNFANKIWNAISLAAFWSHRRMNDCVFNRKQPMMEELSDLVKKRVTLWFKAYSRDCLYSVHDLVDNLQQGRYYSKVLVGGQDTRKAFTDHLYTSLVQAGFRTFKDDDDIERGENIKLELHKAIGVSRISVVVFSKEYASSRWCLDELLMILECKRTSNHMVLPVFYDVDPSQVKNQTGGFAEAFARHENIEAENVEIKDEWMHKVKEWRAALREVADLGGMVLQNQVDGSVRGLIVVGESLIYYPSAGLEKINPHPSSGLTDANWRMDANRFGGVGN
ncbi:hypothetical protein ACSBR1_019000 [Camellia fascicularis]